MAAAMPALATVAKVLVALVAAALARAATAAQSGASSGPMRRGKVAQRGTEQVAKQGSSAE